ncbi:hypothetical protein AAG570_003296 [Ranatra chinensis]|uniref:PWWP domain-containing protein n=1 Tax=Ranatra chinensis TaxID=642074 RepID=A0ABD0Y6V0_9HEMI
MVLTSNSKILVTVDEALQDILVVSYAFESQLFQGVLLDSTKRLLPCRIPTNVNAVSPLSSPKTETTEEDKLLYSIRQRFTYFQEKPVHHNHFHLPKNAKLTGNKYRNQKMTVRLRPRQVLCSKCKSICNENSENVNYSTRSKKPTDPPDKSPRQLLSENRRDNQPSIPGSSPSKLCNTLIPRLSRLQPNEITSAIKEILDNGQEKEDQDPLDNEEEREKQMVLRKKRSVGSMEDLWDETVFEEGSKKAKTTPVIKISFGSQGEGTVLKIPAKVQTFSESETEDKQKNVTAKAAKKALKKAKKEARRKVMAGTSSPASSLEYRKHRHKVKHKKKHKAERPASAPAPSVKQKLSISLKRLTSNTYEKAEQSGGDSSQSCEEVPDFPAAASPAPGKQTLLSCSTPDGTTVAVGDIVWGKIHGFPWWPAKVNTISPIVK